MAKTASESVNEGEGNKTAAREYNEAQQGFVRSGRVEEKAREAERALDGPERHELEQAEEADKSRSAGEDPELSERTRLRAYEIWEGEGRPEGRDEHHWRQAERELMTKP
jgi:hypothetical protein